MMVRYESQPWWSARPCRALGMINSLQGCVVCLSASLAFSELQLSLQRATVGSSAVACWTVACVRERVLNMVCVWGMTVLTCWDQRTLVSFGERGFAVELDLFICLLHKAHYTCILQVACACATLFEQKQNHTQQNKPMIGCNLCI